MTQPAPGPLALLVATRKGVWMLRSDAARRRFDLDGPHFLGHVIHHAVLDHRDRRTSLIAARTGHLGPTVFRSVDAGKNWQEATSPPAFRKARAGETGRVVDHVFWLEPAHASEPGCWYAGTSPEGLFRSEDGGETWSPVAGFNDHPRDPRTAWVFPMDGTDVWPRTSPDGRPAVYVTRDAGESWQRQDRGLPREQAWFTVRRQAMAVDARDPVGIYFGTTSGEVWGSASEGSEWSCLARHLPSCSPTSTAATRASAFG